MKARAIHQSYDPLHAQSHEGEYDMNGLRARAAGSAAVEGTQNP